MILASCADLPSSDGDEAGLLDALGAADVQAFWAPWDDAETDFTAADLVVLRSTWDYPSRRDDFLKWCEWVPRLANPAPVVRWNTDKAYLADLARQGTNVIPTELIGPAQRPAWPEVEFVLKPSVGAGSRGARRFRPDEMEAAAEHLSALRARTPLAVLQPYQSTVDQVGETALVFFRGSYSHAFLKAPMLPAPEADDAPELDPSGLFEGERLRPATPEADLRRAAEEALDAACVVLDVSRTDLLYARVDLVRDAAGAPLLLELELTEPSLGFAQADPGALRRFATAVRASISDQQRLPYS